MPFVEISIVFGEWNRKLKKKKLNVDRQLDRRMIDNSLLELADQES